MRYLNMMFSLDIHSLSLREVHMEALLQLYDVNVDVF